VADCVGFAVVDRDEGDAVMEFVSHGGVGHDEHATRASDGRLRRFGNEVDELLDRAHEWRL
jgi:hypothetical protein